MTDFYGTLIGFDDYHQERNNAVPTGANDSDILAALLVASEYIDQKYLKVFPSYKVGQRSQEREWPRTGAVDWYGYPINGIPIEMENATYEVALIQLSNPGSLTTNVVPAKTFKSVSVDGAVAVTYAGASSVFDMQLSIPAVDRILAPILTGDNTGSSLSAPAMRV